MVCLSFYIFFRNIGGIPVNRDRNESLTTKLAREFQNRKWMHLGITPEGTRKACERVEEGFYFIALKANVPILLVGLDYAKKEAKALDLFYPTGDYKSDIVKLNPILKHKSKET
ncbi:MAG: 1-acyl-sn-glycerol-3-phosphate acyltransferase [Fermentimonas caenicola]